MCIKPFIREKLWLEEKFENFSALGELHDERPEESQLCLFVDSAAMLSTKLRTLPPESSCNLFNFFLAFFNVVEIHEEV